MADAVGNDVTNRIRAAIKCKLVDVGCYVDNELPDYVMVMIANKKTKEQMRQDLSLFLNEHTDSFCEWLHEVLDHLQRFAREGKQRLDIFDEKKVKSDSKADGKRGSGSTAGKTREVKKADEDTLRIQNEENDEFAEEVAKESDLREVARSARRSLKDKKKERSRSPVSRKETSKPEKRESPDRDKRRKAIEFKETKSREKKVEKNKEDVRKKPVDVPEKVRREKEERRKEEEPRKEKRKLISPPRKRSPSPAKSVQKSVISVIDSKGRRVIEKITRTISSTIGAVVTNVVQDNSDEEYDPAQPHMKSVATVLPRKRLVMDKESLEKNKILAKAMFEANRSAQGASKKRRSGETYPGDAKRSVRDRLGSYASNISMSSSSKKDSTTTEHSSRSQSRSNPRIIVTMNHVPSDINTSALTADQECELEDLRLALLRGEALKASAKPTGQGSSGDVKMLSKENKEITEKQVEFIDEDKPILGDERRNDKEFSLMKAKAPAVVPLEAVKEKSTNGKEEKVIPVAKTKPTCITSPVGFTKTTVVPVKEKKKEESMKEALSSDPNVIARNGMLVKPSPLLAVCGISVQKSEVKKEPIKAPTAEDTDSTVTKPKSAIAEKVPLTSLDEEMKRKERCRFWPNCSNQSCQFHHPTEPCSVFPHCKFADKCLYKHPICKFNALCTNVNCPFTHVSKKATVLTTQASPVQVPCKFFPNCANPHCPFYHPPIPCKFGLRCTALGCPFVHPSKSATTKLKWVAGSA